MSKENPTKYDRLRDKRKALGLCISCGQDPSLTRHVLCQKCMDVRRERSVRVIAEQASAGLCTRCGGQRDPSGLKVCSTCSGRDRSGRVAKLSQRRSIDPRLCTQCGLRPGDTNGGYCKSCKRRWRKFKAHLKNEVIAGYGGMCSCCREDEFDFLTIDHINRDGKQHRKAMNGGTGVYADLKERSYPEGYRVLCFNCHSAITFFGICPHQRDREANLVCDGPLDSIS